MVIHSGASEFTQPRLMLTTSINLLERVRRPEDEAAWSRFVSLYIPMLTRWTRESGLEAQDGLDVVQDVLVTLVNQLPQFHYDPARGSFRGWIKTLTFRQIAAHRGQRVIAGGVGTAIDPPAPPESSAEEGEYRAFLVRRALELMKGDFEETTWRACWEHIVTGHSAIEVGRQLGLSEGAVHVAKCRVLRRLRDELQGLLD